jgi:hypothetical protein
MAAQPSPIWKRTLVWLNTIPISKSKGKSCMVEEPSHAKQLSLNQVSKIVLILKKNYFIWKTEVLLSRRIFPYLSTIKTARKNYTSS